MVDGEWWVWWIVAVDVVLVACSEGETETVTCVGIFYCRNGGGQVKIVVMVEAVER